MDIGVTEGKAKQKPYAGRCMTVEEWPKAGSLRVKRYIKETRTLLPVRIYRHTKYSLGLCPAVRGRVLVKDVASSDLLTGSHCLLFWEKMKGSLKGGVQDCSLRFHNNPG